MKEQKSKEKTSELPLNLGVDNITSNYNSIPARSLVNMASNNASEQANI